MEKRYQVFVSSTYSDLQAERAEVIRALLEQDCIPSGMELFPAADKSQWEIIKNIINACDYYVLILAGRYGSLGDDGFSFTEMEYRYAIDIGKPVIAFLHREPGKISADKTEASESGKEKLEAFRDLVRKKLCKMWANPDELGAVVSRSLMMLIKSTPAVGWVRANDAQDPKDAAQILALKQRVEELEDELTRLGRSAPKGSEKLAQGEETFRLRFTCAKSGRYGSHSPQQGEADVSWNSIFARVSPLLLGGIQEVYIRENLGKFVGEMMRSTLAQDPSLSDPLVDFSLNAEDFKTIIVQFRALGLIEPGKGALSWRLTPHGDELMTALRAIPSERQSTPEEIVS